MFHTIVSRLIFTILVTAATSESVAADYLREIKPLLEEKCFACHGSLQQRGSLRLDTVKAMIAGGDSGSAIIPGNVEESYLLGVLTGECRVSHAS